MVAVNPNAFLRLISISSLNLSRRNETTLECPGKHKEVNMRSDEGRRGVSDEWERMKRERREERVNGNCDDETFCYTSNYLLG